MPGNTGMLSGFAHRIRALYRVILQPTCKLAGIWLQLAAAGHVRTGRACKSKCCHLTACARTSHLRPSISKPCQALMTFTTFAKQRLYPATHVGAMSTARPDQPLTAVHWAGHPGDEGAADKTIGAGGKAEEAEHPAGGAGRPERGRPSAHRAKVRSQPLCVLSGGLPAPASNPAQLRFDHACALPAGSG